MLPSFGQLLVLTIAFLLARRPLSVVKTPSTEDMVMVHGLVCGWGQSMMATVRLCPARRTFDWEQVMGTIDGFSYEVMCS